MQLIEDLITSGAQEISPYRMDHIVRMLPQLRMKLASLEDQRPDLTLTLDFLSQIVEDFAAGLCRDLPFHAAAEIAFALEYLDKDIDLIPDSLPEIGFADDAAVSNRVLERHQAILKDYADDRGFVWGNLVTM